MGTTSARTAALIIDNSQKVLGIELFSATQAIWLRGEKNLSPTTQAVYDFVRKSVAPVDQDIVMHNELVKFDEMIKEHKISAAAEKVCGNLK
jgi:histidine ammonia-lyase